MTPEQLDNDLVRRRLLMLAATRTAHRHLLRESSALSLLRGMCDTLAEVPGCLWSWGVVLDGTGRIDGVTASRLDDTQAAFEYTLDQELPQCLEKALSAKEVALGRVDVDACSSCPMSEWCSGESTRFALALRNGEERHGGLVFAAPAWMAGDDEARSLLCALAEDAGYGLHKIRATEELHLRAAILDEIRDHVTVTDLEGRIVYVNPVEIESMKRSREELIGQSVEIYGEDARRGPRQQDIVRVVRETGEWRGEMVNYAADGEEVIFDCRVWMLHDAQGTLRYLCGVSRDVTQNKRAETVLRASEERFRSLTETTSDWVWEIDRDSVYVYTNPKVRDILGYEPEEILGKAPFDLMPPEEAEVIRRQFITILEARAPFSGLLNRNVHKSGRIVFVETSGVPVVDEHGCFAGFRGIDRDITERVLAEQALQVSEERYRTLYNGIRDAVILTDLERRIQHCNAAFLELFGYDLEEIQGINTRLIFHREEEYQQLGQALKAFMGGPSFLFACDFKKKSGQVFPGEASVYYMTDDRRRVTGYIGGIRDITTHKETEKRLQHAVDRVEHVLDSITDAFFSLNEHLVVTYFNPAAEMALHCPCDKVLGRNLFDVFSEARGSIFEQEYRYALAHRQPRYFETYFGIPPLENWYEVRVYPHDEGISVFFQVITERKRVEAALAHERDLLQALMDNIPDLIYFKDVEGRFVRVNLAQARLLGVASPDEAVGKTDFDYFDREYAQNTFEDERRVLVHGELLINKLERLKVEAGSRWMTTTKVPLVSPEGQPTGLVGISRDVTEQRQAEEEHARFERQIQQTQKLESLGVLAGGIAHDFNNILMAVLGHAELALEELSPVAPARDSIQQIETAARRASELCRQMLAYTGRASLVPEVVCLSEVVEEMAHLLKTSISKKAILNLHIKRDLPPILADPSQMRQVIMNLIVNASEAIGERSGVISISLGSIVCDEEYLRATYLENELASGEYVFIEVADTGCGMSRETQSRIFEPFFSTKFSGRGLGMAAVMGIIRGHRGAIKLYSEPEKGTTFKLLFPAVEKCGEDTADAGDATGSGDWRGHGTVLLVDDEASLRDVGRRVLKRLGFDTLAACDGREALEIYRAHGDSIRLVLLDLTMPHMDGVETFRELRRLDPEARVVLVSGYSEQDVASRFAGKGLSAIIQKPYRLATLRETLKRVLG